ncbi:MAG: hypothetical protein IEMM0006_0083 [bacterium]|nr:MAG: hypothetical protein IEMM0006_0083 [bacterium]
MNDKTIFYTVLKNNEKQTASRNFHTPLHFDIKSALFHRFYNFADDKLKVVYAEI